MALSYGAGALTVLSPCVLPLLPVVLFGVLQAHVLGPLALAAGLSASFAIIGIFVARIGFGLGLDAETIRYAGAAMIGVVGVVLLVPALQDRMAAMASPVATGGQGLLDRLKPSGLGGQFVLGALLGAIWSPCSGPTLGTAIGLAAQRDTASQAALSMAIFGLGAATPILALAYSSRQTIFKRRERLARLAQIGKPAMGYTLVAVALFVLTGFDKIAETYLTSRMPDWLVTLTTSL